MKQREKIILALAFIAVIYAVYVLLFAESPQQATGDTTGDIEETKTLVVDLAKRLTSDDTMQVDMHIISRAAAKWPRQPFLVSELALESSKTEADDTAEKMVVDLSYTGFLEVGDKRLAVINGMEYEIGERLNSGDYTVRDIMPTQTIVERNQDRMILKIPLKETTSASIDASQSLQQGDNQEQKVINPMDVVH